MKTSPLVLLGLLTVLLSLELACSSSSSVVTDGEKALRQVIQNESKGQISLTGFRKKDGREIDKTTYELIYEADLRFEATGTWMTGSTLESGIGFNFRVPQGQQLQGFAAMVERDIVGGRDVVKGGTAKISGSMVGQKFESGWKFGIKEAEISLGMMSMSKPEISPKPESQPKGANSKESKEVQHVTADAQESLKFEKEVDQAIRNYFKTNHGNVLSISNIYEWAIGVRFDLALEFERPFSVETPIQTIAINRGDKANIEGVIESGRTTNGWICKSGLRLEIKECSNGSLLQYERIRSGMNACKNNLRQIDGAKEQWALEARKSGGAAPDINAINKYILRGPPTCPSGGVYNYNSVDIEPSCSIAAHALSFKKSLPSPFASLIQRSGSVGSSPIESAAASIDALFPASDVNAKARNLRKDYARAMFVCQVGFEQEPEFGNFVPRYKANPGDKITFRCMSTISYLPSGPSIDDYSLSIEVIDTAANSVASKPLDEIGMRSHCQKNLRQIDGAKEQWALEHKKKTGEEVINSEVDEYIKFAPLKCPAGGSYTYGPIDSPPTCSIAGHTL